MELEVTPGIPTLIGQLRVPDADAMNQDLQALILAEETRYSSLGRSNIGGWHSRADFLNRPEPAVAALTTWVTLGVSRMVDATAGPGLSKARCPFRAGRRSAAPARIMRHTLIRTAHGPVCITSMPAQTARIARSAACWSFSTPCRCGSRDRAGRPVRGTCSSPARSGTARDLSELALSLGASLRGSTPAHRRFVQRNSGDRTIVRWQPCSAIQS